MKLLNLQLDTPPSITRDLHIKLVHEATGREVEARPFLDGSAAIRNLDAGYWRMKVQHPNLVYDVVDKRIRVFPDRPTFVPVQVPRDIFTNTAVRDIPDADLGPEQARLLSAAEQADRQANKLGGQPIFADDWNDLASTVAEIARSTRDLTSKVSPLGHDHPEIVARIDEVQTNLEKFFDVFGKTLAQIQRQIQMLALNEQMGRALDKIPALPADKRREIETLVADLDDVIDDTPQIYTSRLKRTGEKLASQLALVVPDDDAVRKDPAVAQATLIADALSKTLPSQSYTTELENHKKLDNQRAQKAFRLALNK
ncbi:MAG: hypothetical protein ABW321_25895 [Polyangiales bacterium]